MKHTRFLAVLLLLVACCTTAFAAEAPVFDAGAQANDVAYFASVAQSANWLVPEGYSLESYVSADINEDGLEETIASLLAENGTDRLLAVFVSDGGTYHVHTSEKALPATNAGAWENDPFEGFSAGNGYLNIHTATKGVVDTEQIYSFGVEGTTLYLDFVYATQWNESTEVAMEDMFNLIDGIHDSLRGHMHGHVFHAEETLASNRFDSSLTVFTLEDFDINEFPVTWSEFAQMLAARQNTPTARPQPKPTKRPTARPTRVPKPTGGILDPVYPTDMPGPVYPTDMPGPVYPTDMPGPVYPTPTPTVTPTPIPEPTDIPGPIWGDADSGSTEP